MSMLVRAYCLPFQAASSFPLAIRYRTFPSAIFWRLQQIGALESQYATYAANKESTAKGIYQILAGTSVMNQVWYQLPAIVSIPLQHVDLVAGMMKKDSGWNGGIDRMTIEHHGLIKYSSFLEGEKDPYMKVVEGKPYIPIPVEPIVLIPIII